MRKLETMWSQLIVAPEPIQTSHFTCSTTITKDRNGKDSNAKRPRQKTF